MSSIVASPATVAPSFNAPKPSVVVVRRRNALVPLPLLPPVPKNTIVTSVKILHNQEPDSPPESPTSDEGEDGARDPAPPKEDNEAKVSSSPPMSPTQTSFNFSPLSSNKRARPQRRRSCCTPCSPPPPCSNTRGSGNAPLADMCQSQSPGTPGEVGTPLDTNNNTIPKLKVRKPRSTIVVTVRLANPAPSPLDASSGTNYFSPSPPTTGPAILSRQKSRNFTALSLKKSRFMNLQSSNNINYTPRASSPPPPPPVPAKPQWNRPRVSSNLARCKPICADDDIMMEDDIVMETETEDVLYVSAGSPPALSGRLVPSKTSILKARSTSGFRAASNRPVKAKKGKASKTGSRLAMLRWAVLNQSGPEVGMRIKAMGVRLAKEIWEAERCLDDDEEEMTLERGSMTMEGSIVSSAVAEQDKTMQDAEETTTLQTERERIAEECIRELEDMDVDQEVDQEMSPSTTEQDEQCVKDNAAVLPNEDAMDIDTTTTVTVQTITPKTTSPSTTQTPTSRSQRRLSFPKRLQVRVDCEVQVLSKTASNTNVPRRRSLVDDKLPIMVAAKKWFEKTAL